MNDYDSLNWSDLYDLYQLEDRDRVAESPRPAAEKAERLAAIAKARDKAWTEQLVSGKSRFIVELDMFDKHAPAFQYRHDPRSRDSDE